MSFVLTKVTAECIHFKMNILHVFLQSFFEPETFLTNSAGKPSAGRISVAKVPKMLFQVLNGFAALCALFCRHKVTFIMDLVLVL